MKRTAIMAGATVLMLSVALAGCSSDTPAPDASEPTTASKPAVDPARVSPTDLPKLPAVKKAQGAIKDLSLGECKTKAGKQRVEGTIKSSQDKAGDFLVTVSWTTATGDVMGRGFAVVEDIPPGKSESFTIKATVAPGASQCVKGVEFGTIKS